MNKQKSNNCEICRRLGKSQCGYHQFKNRSLSKISNSRLQESKFAQTQSSIHRNQPILLQSNYVRTHTPTKNNKVTFNYQTQSPLRQLNINTPTSIPSSRLYHTPPKVHNIHHIPQPPQHQYIQGENIHHIVRTQGNQVLYYPIYPVYQIVYEPVNNYSLASSRRI